MKQLKFLVIFSPLLLTLTLSVAAQKMTADEVISKHLDSIGTAEKRAGIKSLIAVGDTTVKFISEVNHKSEGRIVLASAATKNFLGMSLNATDYPSEKFGFDGEKLTVGIVRAGTRSVLRNFVQSNKILLSEGLFGGTLANSWALLKRPENKATLTYEGTKKIDGTEVYAIGFSVKGAGDLDISLYFDKETFRHLRTEYRRISSAGFNKDPNQSSRFNETRFKLVEDFSDFKAIDGITLPHSYVILYSTSGQNGTTEVEWKSKLTEFAFNQTFPDSTFNVENQ